MREIQLNKGFTALVDDEDYERVAQYNWYIWISNTKRRPTPKYYAKRVFSKNGKIKNKMLHRFILNLEDSKVLVDHIDGNGLNCQKLNMRFCSAEENSRSRNKTNVKKSSKYIGVCWRPNRLKWQAAIKQNNR